MTQIKKVIGYSNLFDFYEVKETLGQGKFGLVKSASHKKTGKKVARLFINKFTCNYNGKEVFASDWHPAVSANPYMAFYVKAQESGMLEFSWTDDKGQVAKKSAKLTVTG